MSKQWEYKVEDISWAAEARKERHLNSLGAEGWELVSVSDCAAYMKREKKAAEPQEPAFPMISDPWASAQVMSVCGNVKALGEVMQ